MIRDRAGLLGRSIGSDTRVLVVEPRPGLLTPADTTALLPAGGLGAAIRERHPAIESIVIEDRVTDEAIADARRRAATSDLVILGTVDALARPSARALAKALVATGVPVVAVALRAPWDADADPDIGTVVASYGIQPPSLAALADALVGGAPISGRLPVRLADA